MPGPLRFRCPSCNSIISTAAKAAGRKAPCPKCGQRLQVPGAPPPPSRKKTVLGVPLEADPAPASRPGTSPAGPRRGIRKLPAAAGLAALVLVGVGVIIARTLFGGPQPATSSVVGERQASLPPAAPVPRIAPSPAEQQAIAVPPTTPPQRDPAPGGPQPAKTKDAAPAPPADMPPSRFANPFEELDRHALAAPDVVEGSSAALADYLAKACSSDQQKARVIYRWITDRIAYDAEGFTSGNLPPSDAGAVLKSRLAVCEGYANLFVALAEQMNLGVVKVHGYAKGIDYTPGTRFARANHAWNVVQAGGQWHLVDATWGAGHLSGERKFVKRYSDYFFMVPPDKLLMTHFPADERWRLTQLPLTRADFERKPLVGRSLLELGVEPAALDAAAKDKAGFEFVKAYSHPGARTAAVDIPLGRRLAAGTTYRFVLESEDYAQFVLVNGSRVERLQKDGTLHQGEIEAQKGELRLGALRRAGDMRFPVILDYEVE